MLIFLLSDGEWFDISQKWIGVLLVSILALISNNGAVCFAAVFIVGLIVAPQEYLLFLAAILSRSEKFLTSKNALLFFRKRASKEETAQKNEEDLAELEEDEGSTKEEKEDDDRDQDGPPSANSSNGGAFTKKTLRKEDRQKYLRESPLVEEAIIRRQQLQLDNADVIRDIKLGDVLMDAVIIHKDPSVPVNFLEIKYYPSYLLQKRPDKNLRKVFFSAKQKLFSCILAIQKDLATYSFPCIFRLFIVLDDGVQVNHTELEQRIQELKMTNKYHGARVDVDITIEYKNSLI